MTPATWNERPPIPMVRPTMAVLAAEGLTPDVVGEDEAVERPVFRRVRGTTLGGNAKDGQRTRGR